MIEQLITDIINDVFHSFDIPFCVVVNIATYLLIKSIIDYKKCNNLSIWQKRIIFIIVGIAIGYFYCTMGYDYKIIFNSIILAPVSWSWIFKPICAKLNIDYNNNTECKK